MSEEQVVVQEEQPNPYGEHIAPIMNAIMGAVNGVIKESKEAGVVFKDTDVYHALALTAVNVIFQTTPQPLAEQTETESRELADVLVAKANEHTAENQILLSSLILAGARTFGLLTANAEEAIEEHLAQAEAEVQEVPAE